MKRYDLDWDGIKEDPEGTYVKHDDVSEYPYVDIQLWEQWAREACADFNIEYDTPPVGLRFAITEKLAEINSDLRQCRAMLADDEITEEECIRMIEPVVGYDRELPYVLRLPAAIMRLISLIPNAKPPTP